MQHEGAPRPEDHDCPPKEHPSSSHHSCRHSRQPRRLQKVPLKNTLHQQDLPRRVPPHPPIHMSRIPNRPLREAQPTPDRHRLLPRPLSQSWSAVPLRPHRGPTSNVSHVFSLQSIPEGRFPLVPTATARNKARYNTHERHNNHTKQEATGINNNTETSPKSEEEGKVLKTYHSSPTTPLGTHAASSGRPVSAGKWNVTPSPASRTKYVW